MSRPAIAIFAKVMSKWDKLLGFKMGGQLPPRELLWAPTYTLSDFERQARLELHLNTEGRTFQCYCPLQISKEEYDRIVSWLGAVLIVNKKDAPPPP